MIDRDRLVAFLWDLGIEPDKIAAICAVLETDTDEDLFDPIISSESEWYH
jgi:hypothetical protein